MSNLAFLRYCCLLVSKQAHLPSIYFSMGYFFLVCFSSKRALESLWFSSGLSIALTYFVWLLLPFLLEDIAISAFTPHNLLLWCEMPFCLQISAQSFITLIVLPFLDAVSFSYTVPHCWHSPPPFSRNFTPISVKYLPQQRRGKHLNLITKYSILWHQYFLC